jgi:hypothetical protein
MRSAENLSALNFSTCADSSLYEQLDKSRPLIRVLQILPSPQIEEPVICRLKTVSLDDKTTIHRIVLRMGRCGRHGESYHQQCR